jgi:hypothetical protein
MVKVELMKKMGVIILVNLYKIIKIILENIMMEGKIKNIYKFLIEDCKSVVDKLSKCQIKKI